MLRVEQLEAMVQGQDTPVASLFRHICSGPKGGEGLERGESIHW